MARWLGPILAALLLGLQPASALYCGTDSCYHVLGVKEKASLADIRKAYRNLSLTHHPDKNPGAEAKARFQAIAQAYEILSDARLRKAHDYALDHPDEFMFNKYQYYSAYSQRVVKSDLRLVLGGFVALVSALQYLNKAFVYRTAMDNVRKSNKYKSLVKRIQLEASSASGPAAAAPRGARKGAGAGAGPVNRKKGKGAPGLSPEELQARADREVNLVGTEPPTLRDTLAYQLAVLPLTLYRVLRWEGEWAWKYWVQKQPYDSEAQEYLTRSALRMDRAHWEALSPEARAAWLGRELWDPANAAAYQADEVRKEKRRYKRFLRDAPPMVDAGE